jgi:RND family efflux transporter MFP subunit
VTAAAHVKVATAQLAEAKARLARADVRAPADGIILTRTVEVGQTAMPGGEVLFRLSKDGETELRGQVAEQDLPLLKVGQLVDVKLTGTSKIYQGKIRLLGAVIDPATRLGTVKVSLTPDTNLRPGAFARAEVTVSKAERAVLPQTAVLNDDKGSYVLIVNAQGKIERRAIRVTGMVPSGVTIAEGINPTDQIVTTAGAFLQEGETVKPVLVAAGKS